MDELLQCPICRSALFQSEEILRCEQCGSIDQSISGGQQLDLRPKKSFVRDVRYVINPTDKSGRESTYFGELLTNDKTKIDFNGIQLPSHLTPTMASYIPSPIQGKSVCLDLGCGSGEYRRVLENVGYHWVGCDYGNINAPILADAHSLPFADNSFDFVIALAVLEHLKYTSVALREVYRTMKPGATFLGSVTYLAPFHDSASYFNMTHEGVYTSLCDAGFEVDVIAGEKHYMGIHAVCYSGLFLGASRRRAYAVANTVLKLSQWWWKWRRRKNLPQSDESNELLINTGAFIFVARKRN